MLKSFTEEFGISYAEAGWVISIVLIPGVLLGLPAGLLVGKHGIKRVGFISLVTVSVGSLVTATANIFPTLLIGRLILGIGGTFIITATPATIAQWFAQKELGKAMGIFAINMPLATVIALPAAKALSISYGWRFPFYVGLALGLSAAVVFVALIKEGPFARQERITGIRETVSNFEIWKVGLVWLFFNAAALSFTIWGTTLFESFQGISMDSVQGSVMASLLMLTAIFFVPVFGYLIDKTGKRKLFAIIGCLAMALAFVAIAFTSDIGLIASILALGIAAAIVPPTASVLPVEILGPALASIGFGITGICLNIGAATAQPLIGFILDSTQAYVPPLIAMAVLSTIGAIIAYTLKTR
jgi:MFS family permease